MDPTRAHRGGSIAMYVMGLICFCLPWIDVQCPEKCHATARNEQMRTHAVRLSQSGWQMATGGYSAEVDGKPVTDRNGFEAQFFAAKPEFAAPLIAGFPTALLLGIAACVLISDRRWRTLLVCTASALALGEVVVQIGLGFPIAGGQSDTFSHHDWEYTQWFFVSLAAPLGAAFIAIRECTRKARAELVAESAYTVRCNE